MNTIIQNCTFYGAKFDDRFLEVAGIIAEGLLMNAQATVRAAIDQRLSGFVDVRIILFEPNGAPKSEEMTHAPKAPNMTPRTRRTGGAHGSLSAGPARPLCDIAGSA